MTTQLYSHEIFQQHRVNPGHPERPDRLKVIDEVLSEPKFFDLKRIMPEIGDPALIELVHPAGFVNKIKEIIPDEGLNQLDPDTFISPESWNAVLHALGASTAAIDSVLGTETDNAFLAIRPPGHHAERVTAMGFCLVNHIAIAARYAQEKFGVERVAIIDWDVHHGNGTQDIFYDDPSVMFASTHQMPLFPGSGAENETGVGNIFNTPLRANDGSEVFKQAFLERVIPAVENFSPDLILISAGFDAHRLDPLASINLVADDFDWATGKIMEIAATQCENRLVSFLEGGYSLDGLGQSVDAHVTRLLTG